MIVYIIELFIPIARKNIKYNLDQLLIILHKNEINIFAKIGIILTFLTQ